MPAQQTHEKPSYSRLVVLGAVTFYLIAALAMILANKWVLNTTTTPLFFLFLQLLVAVILLLLSRALGILKFPVIPTMQILKGLAPLACLSVLGLTFNNFTLQLVDASYYQVARGLLIPMTVVTSFVFLHSRPSLRILGACGIVTGGFLVGVLLDQSYSSSTKTASPLGIVFGLFSSLITAMHAVLIKRSLEIVPNTIELAWYSNLMGAVIMLPCVFLAGEGPEVAKFLSPAAAKTIQNGALNTFIYGTGITGVFGFLICVAGFLSIKITSPITHMISSGVRSVFQSFLGMWLFHDIITTGRATSIGVILVGSLYYTWVKNEESIAKVRHVGGERPTGDSQYAPLPLEDLEGKDRDRDRERNAQE